MWIRVLIVVSILTAVILIARAVITRPKGIFEVRVRAGGVEVHGSVPALARGDAVEFLNSLKLPAGARIRAIPEGRGMRLLFTKDIEEEDRQRIRNFFYM